MNIRQLRSFVAVCRQGTISGASDAVHITQPALSRQIQELESEFGCTLFSRGKRRVTLTEAGYAFLRRAEEILALESRLHEEVSQAAGASGGLVRIGCVESSASRVLATMAARWQKRFPGLQLEVYGADGDDIRRELDQDRIDFGVVLTPVETARYDALEFPASDRWGVVMRRAETGGRGCVGATDIGSMRLILPRRRIVIDEISRFLGVSPESIQPVAYHNLATNALELVRAGIGTVVCVEGSYALRASDDLAFLPFSPVRLTSHRLIRRRNRPLARICEALWESCAAGGQAAERNPVASP